MVNRAILQRLRSFHQSRRDRVPRTIVILSEAKDLVGSGKTPREMDFIKKPYQNHLGRPSISGSDGVGRPAPSGMGQPRSFASRRMTPYSAAEILRFAQDDTSRCSGGDRGEVTWGGHAGRSASVIVKPFWHCRTHKRNHLLSHRPPAITIRPAISPPTTCTSRTEPK